MAYEAAVSAKVPTPLIDILVLDALKSDVGWYIEHGHITCDRLAKLEAEAVERCMPMLGKWIADMDVEPYVRAPIVSKQAWNSFVEGLPLFSSRSSPLTRERTVRASL